MVNKSVVTFMFYKVHTFKQRIMSCESSTVLDDIACSNMEIDFTMRKLISETKTKQKMNATPYLT